MKEIEIVASGAGPIVSSYFSFATHIYIWGRSSYRVMRYLLQRAR